MIKKAYIHEYGNGRMEPEHKDLHAVLESRGIPCELFTTKRLSRSQLNLNPSALVVGNHDIMKTVFKRMQKTITAQSYPTVLEPYLKRTIWQNTVGGLLDSMPSRTFSPFFVKPVDNTKAFTGFVAKSEEDLFPLYGYSRRFNVHCSNIVEWQSEFRVFVVNDKIVGYHNYAGNTAIALDREVVEKAIKDLSQSEEKTAGYGIDFGVLESGETALVEWNDGFALGSYGLDPEKYTDLILARWNEIMRNN